MEDFGWMEFGFLARYVHDDFIMFIYKWWFLVQKDTYNMLCM